MREFIRHSSEFPVAIKVAGEAGSRRGCLRDLSVAGLSFDVASKIDVGSKINFYVPSLSDEPAGRGHVVWCRPLRASYRLGVEFETAQDAYRTRMVEQVCQIENYRREVKELEGRVLEPEEAAVEWIESYAADFDRRFS
ncbi:PilZ domain-containing protein [uncultured Zhongshania sp.]|uniref:PilZ domain-containing protein n=1 Tax=uncultured Zhongshania sp. TaxID=1642288 RepID=UPI0025F39AAE|nr:PilZ domain-containing protein [uncultured Zhongshania sp.]